MSTAANSQSAAPGPREVRASAAAASSFVSLKTLAPGYLETRHGTYVRRLEAAVVDPQNLNIALTGPYGTGKSSVLDEFAVQRKDSTLRLAISTLGPDPEERSLTNRIPKELVTAVSVSAKQTIYSASAKTLGNSRFRRISPTPLKVAVWESAAGVAILGALLALLGRLPTVAWTDDAHVWPVRALV